MTRRIVLLSTLIVAAGGAQIFGTQYVGQPGDPLTQGKFDAALIPDSLRIALGVPTLEQQEAQRLQFQKLNQAR